MDFNPDLSGDSNQEPNKLIKDDSNIIEVKPADVVSVAGNSSDVISIKNLVGMTLTHMEDDIKCREDVENINNTLEDLMGIMSTKELIEYLKVKLNERRFHVECVFKAYEFIQKTELAKEILLGSERKERIIRATNSSTYNKLIGMLNMHSNDDTGNK